MRYQALDSWRGICAIMVLFYHFSVASHIYTIDFIRNSFLFVDFFFVLSGFVIAVNYKDRLMGDYGIGRFMTLRFGRVYPLHVFMLILFVLLEVVVLASPELSEAIGRTAFNDEQHSLKAIGTNLLLIQTLEGVHGAVTWNIPAWSISVEFYTYVVFAIGLWLLGKLPWPGFLLIVAMTGIMIGAPILIYSVAEDQNIFLLTSGGLIRSIFGFAAGVVAFLLQKRFGARIAELLRNRGVATVIEALTILATIGFISRVGFSSYNLVAPYIFAFVILIFAAEKGLFSALLKRPFLLYLGLLSYSLYLTHFFVQEVMYYTVAWVETHGAGQIFDMLFGYEVPDELVPNGHLWAGDAGLIISFILTLAMSAMTYRFIEKPGRDAARNWVNRPSKAH